MRFRKAAEECAADLRAAHVQGVQVGGRGAGPRRGVAGGVLQPVHVAGEGGRHVGRVQVRRQRPRAHRGDARQPRARRHAGQRGVARGEQRRVDGGRGGARGHDRVLGHLQRGHYHRHRAVVPCGVSSG